MVGPAAAAAFIRTHTVLGHAPLVPEFALFLASEITPIWQATEDWLHTKNIAPPFWAFAWPGSQALAREILDRPALVAGRHVLDFAAGCGLASLAAAKAGAASVEAAEIDPLAIAATQLNARENGLVVTGLGEDVVGAACRWDIIFTGDVFYEAKMSSVIAKWLSDCVSSGAKVIVADPGRKYLPKKGLFEVASYEVPTSFELEDKPVRTTKIYEMKSQQDS